MKNHFEIIKKCPLFSGIDPEDLEKLLDCLSATKKVYKRNSFVFLEGQAATSVGVVLSGKVHIIQEDFWGNHVILTHVGPGDLFGEALSCAQIDSMPISVMAVEESEILLLDYKRIITTCPTTCGFHTNLIKNMMGILAKKNVALTEKMGHITKTTTRQKILSYLSAQATLNKSSSFQIPFNRQGMADYLSVDRSAMSAELSRMRDEGIIEFERDHFQLLKDVE